MNKENQGLSKTFWILGSAAVLGLVGGVYYLYNLFSQEEELSEEQKLQIEEMKQEVEDTNGELTPELAVQTMALTNKFAEEMMKKMKPDIDERRRAAINNPEEYEKICAELFECKEHAYNTATNRVLAQFGFSMEDLQKVMSRVSPFEIEKKVYEYEKPSFEGTTIPEKAKVKEAFCYYGKKFTEEMKEFHNMMNQNQVDPSQQDYVIFRLLVLKMRVDDELYFKYKYIESQIRYLLYEYNLFEDPDVRRVHESITRLDDMFNMG
jgi:hypothetical protein